MAKSTEVQAAASRKHFERIAPDGWSYMSETDNIVEKENEVTTSTKRLHLMTRRSCKQMEIHS